jgi:hypothetical protein
MVAHPIRFAAVPGGSSTRPEFYAIFRAARANSPRLAAMAAMAAMAAKGQEMGQTIALVAVVGSERLLLGTAAVAMALAEQHGKVGVVGYCWGGSVSFLAGCGLDAVAYAVIYCGRHIVEPCHEKVRCHMVMRFDADDAPAGCHRSRRSRRWRAWASTRWPWWSRSAIPWWTSPRASTAGCGRSASPTPATRSG